MIFYGVTSHSGYDFVEGNTIYFGSLREAKEACAALRASRKDYALERAFIDKIDRATVLNLLNHSGYISRTEILETYKPCCGGVQKPYPDENEIIPGAHNEYCSKEQRAKAKPVRYKDGKPAKSAVEMKSEGAAS